MSMARGRCPSETVILFFLGLVGSGLSAQTVHEPQVPERGRIEGFGASTAGGSGGRLIRVRSLADSGPGTLREALGESGPRIIRFEVEGVIELASRLRCTEGRVTIDGTSAPGKGITLRNHGLGFVNCSDIIVRGLRIRVNTGGTSGDGILLWGKDGKTVRGVAVDHCSVMGATDEVVNTWGSVENVTFQWCTIAEGKRPHSKAWLSGEGSNRITIHHCLLANCDDRNPKLEGGQYDFVNNVVANWGNNNATKVRLGARVNVVNNVYVPGPVSVAQKGCVFIEDPPKGLKLFVSGNVFPLTADGDDPWNLVTLHEPVAGAWVERRPAPTVYRAEKPFDTPPVTTQSAKKACELVLDYAGATVRDEADEGVVKDVRRYLVGSSAH